MPVRRFQQLMTLALLLAASFTLPAADHADAPLTRTDPAADIDDVFVFMNPNNANELVLAMTVNPVANDATRFSDAVNYVFHVTNAEGNLQVSCTFDQPDELLLTQLVNCTAPGNRTVSGDIGVVNTHNDFRVFAGLRDDPFFFDQEAWNQTVKSGSLSFTHPGTDAFAGLNALAIVVGISRTAFKPAQSNDYKLKVWASTERTAGDGISTGISGSWFGKDPDQDGHGYNIEVIERPQDGRYEYQLLVYDYNYLDGNQIFMLGDGHADKDHVHIPMLVTSGPEFGDAYDTGDLVVEDAGTLSLFFTGCDSGNAVWEGAPDHPELGDFEFEIQRLTNLKDVPCAWLQQGQIDRMGRPAINVFLIASGRRDAYNQATDPDSWVSAFASEMVPVLNAFDALDGVTGNALGGNSATLANSLADDRLQIDAGKPVCGTFHAVELDDASNCGGRTLDADWMDALLTALIGTSGPGIGDGVDANDYALKSVFPFIPKPTGWPFDD